MLMPRGIAREGGGHIRASFCGVQDVISYPRKMHGYHTSLINGFPPKTRHAIERDILHRLTWRELTVGW